MGYNVCNKNLDWNEKIMKKYLITGGAGFIGSNIVEFLKKNRKCKVKIYDNLSNGNYNFIKNFIDNDSFIFIKGDLLDGENLNKSMADIDTVIHLAANSDISVSSKNTSIDLNQTLIATYNIMESMRKNNVKNIIYSSGSGVYGDLGNYAPDENYGPLYPTSLYGATKLGAEAMISAFSSLFSINAYIFRFANVIGKNQTHGVAYDFIKRLKINPRKLNILGNGNQNKSYVHVDDIIDAIFLVYEKNLDGIHTYNVTSGDAITVKEIALLVIKIMNLSNVNLEYTNSPFGWPGDVPIVRMSDNKIKNMGWRPQFNSLEAMSSSIEAMIKNNG